MSLYTWIFLIGANLVWSANPAMSKILIGEVGPQLAAWLRYVGALAAILPFFLIKGGRKSKGFDLRLRSFEIVLFFVVGFMAFCVTPLAQMTGLSKSSATENTLIVAMEPLLTVVLAWVLIKEKIGLSTFLAFLAAVSGFLILASGGGRLFQVIF